MKKVRTVSLASLMFLILASAVAYALRFSGLKSIWIFLGLGVGILIASGVLAVFAKKDIKINILCSAASAVALGFLIRAWYIFRGFDNSFWIMLFVSGAAVLYLWLFYALAHINFFNTHFKTYVILYVFISVVIYIIAVALTKTTFVSTFGFYMVIEIAFIFAMCKSTENKAELIRAITISTYSVFVVAVIIALLVLLDGDADFDLDFDIGADFLDGSEKKKNKNVKND